MKCWQILLLLPALLQGTANYTAEPTKAGGMDVVRLSDARSGTTVAIAPALGNRAFELKVHGKNLVYFPFTDVRSFDGENARKLNGIPFLAPWANRLAGGGFWANNERYNLNPSLGTVSLSKGQVAIHGLLTASPLWQVTEIKADHHSAHVTSRLSFWKYPELMANWPFAHEYEMTYTLADGALEVTTRVTNLSSKPMPIAIGFHPYFQIPDTDRSEASIHVAARKHVETDANLVATGELTPTQFPEWVSLRDHTFDDGYTDLVRDRDGRATFSVKAGTKKIDVVYGPRFRVAVIYAPPRQNFVCFEPMTAITNGINLAHEGKYNELQTVAPGASWQESFSLRWSGF